MGRSFRVPFGFTCSTPNLGFKSSHSACKQKSSETSRGKTRMIGNGEKMAEMKTEWKKKKKRMMK